MLASGWVRNVVFGLGSSKGQGLGIGRLSAPCLDRLGFVFSRISSAEDIHRVGMIIVTECSRFIFVWKILFSFCRPPVLGKQLIDTSE